MANRWGKKWKQSQMLFSWAPKSLWTVTTAMKLKDARSLERCDRPRPLNPKGSQLWIFIWRTDADAEAPILWPPDVKSWLFGKDPDAGKDWGQDWMASLAEWAWVWASSRRWWRTGKPGVLQPMGSQRVRHDWTTELSWTEPNPLSPTEFFLW